MRWFPLATATATACSPHTMGRLPHLPSSPAPSRAQDVQPCLSVCSWNGDSEPAFSFNKSLRNVFALSLQFLLLGGNWQGWTAQHLQIYKSCRKNPTVQRPRPHPLKCAVFIKAVKSDFKKPRLGQWPLIWA